ncbi:hypothetical protein [Nocardioides sp. TF02-7]|uniref:hypothetical protein n=1 Tax=Nocardioides sp. TF02-7 TaxID=2917724 RepID=UPI001F06E519|nr:hypothetical protein [Nocardioides sp. TF02-7]UMG94162.1 hypothetical protein MF408_09060 [Nocardioides sp. TF02-7]
MPLAVWVLERRGEAFFQSEAQAGLQEHGASASGVADELRLFQQFSMLTSFPDGRRLYYVQKDSPYWSAFEAIAGALGIEGPLQRSDST